MPSVRLVSERLYFEAIGINEPGTTNVTKEENLWKGKKLAQWQGRKRVTYICNDTVVKSVAVITYLLGAQSFVIAQGKGANRAGKSEKKDRKRLFWQLLVYFATKKPRKWNTSGLEGAIA